MNNNPYRAYWEKVQAQSLQLAQHYTPECLVELCLELLKPTGELFDPCCGLGSFLLKAKVNNENLIISGNDIDPNLGGLPFAFTCSDYLKSENKSSDFIIANIPFNVKKSHCDLVNENYCWIEKTISQTRKRALIILPNMVNAVANKRLEQKRKNIIESGYLELVCQLPNNLFKHTAIAPVIWLINKQKTTKDIYFLNAEKFSEQKDKKTFLNQENIKNIADKTNWTLVNYERIKQHNYLLIPGLYTYQKDEPKLSSEEINQQLLLTMKELESLIEEQDTYNKNLRATLKTMQQEIIDEPSSKIVNKLKNHE